MMLASAVGAFVGGGVVAAVFLLRPAPDPAPKPDVSTRCTEERSEPPAVEAKGPERAPKPAEPTAVKEPVVPPPAVEPRPPKVVQTDVERAAERRRRMARVRSHTIIKHVTAAASGGTAGPDALRSHDPSDRQKADPILLGGPKEKGRFDGGPARVDGSKQGAGKTGGGPAVAPTKAGGKVVVGTVAKTAGPGALDVAAVTHVLRRRRSAFRACYERRLADVPRLAGKVAVRFTLGVNGRVTRIRVASNTTGDSNVASCMTRKLKAWRFSPPQNGSVTFSASLVMSR